jgi:hypothetical protein
VVSLYSAPTTAAARRDRSRAVLLIREHWPIIAVLLPAVAWRVLATIAYRPALWLIGDSISYVGKAVRGPSPYFWRPVGYSFMLFVLKPLHSLLAVVVVQHFFGLAVGLACYVVCRRLGAPRWLATLAAVPILYDGYMLALEQSLLSETLFTVLLLFGLALTLWWPATPGPTWAYLAAGLCLGAADITRSDGLPVALVVAVFLVARRVGIPRVLAFLAMFALPVLLYSAWFERDYREFAVSSTGLQLYGHVMTFANCSRLPHVDNEQTLCRKAPATHKDSQDWYVFSPDSPAYQIPGDLTTKDRAARRFALMVIEHQPLAYAHEVWDTFTSYYLSPKVKATVWYQFRIRYPYLPRTAIQAGREYQLGGEVMAHPSPTLAPVLRAYQRVLYAPGPLYLALALLGLAGWIAGEDRTGGRLRNSVGLLSLSAIAMLALPALLVPDSERYLIPTLPLLSVAAALGGLLLVRRLPRHRSLPRHEGQDEQAAVR